MTLRGRLLHQDLVWLAVALLALMLRALMPGGTMLTAEAGATSIIICTGVGERLLDTGNPDKPLPAAEPCAFAGLLAVALPKQAPLLLVLPTLPLQPALPLKVASRLVQLLSAPPPPATGPPATF